MTKIESNTVNQEELWWLKLPAYSVFMMATCLMLYGCYIPGRSLFWNCAGLFLWLCIGYLRLQKFFRPSFREKLAICCLLSVCILTLTNFPEALGLWLNQAAFDSFATGVKKKYDNWLTVPLAPETDRQFHLGFMPILKYAYEGDGGVYLTTTSRGFFNTCNYGYAYKASPEVWTEEHSRVRHSFHHLWGDWYTFELDLD